jgi:putative zinc finger/helix-turn-helix YgiT family protein
MTESDCKHRMVEKQATRKSPYQFLDSGLSNVSLVGIKYWVCSDCGAVSAEIPAPVQLMKVIAESLVMKKGILRGEEVKFLRKRMGKKASDFAAILGKTPEHLSKLETGKLNITEPLDKLIRLTYGVFCDDEVLLKRIKVDVEAWMKSIHGKKDAAPIQIEKSGTHDWEQLQAV